MSGFISVLLSFHFLFFFWWLINPSRCPYVKDRTRGNAVLVCLFVICVLAFAADKVDNPINQTTYIIGLIIGLVTSLLIIYRGYNTSQSATQVLLDQAEQKIKELENKLEEQTRWIKQLEDARERVKDQLIQARENTARHYRRAVEKEQKLKEIQKGNKNQPKNPENFYLEDDIEYLMEYTGSKGETDTRPIIPKKLYQNNNGDWILSAVDIQASMIKSFRVDRIDCLEGKGLALVNYDDIMNHLINIIT